MPTTFPEVLKKHRDDLHLTQQEAAEKLGMSRRAFIELEMGRRKPRLYEIQGIMALLGQIAPQGSKTALASKS